MSLPKIIWMFWLQGWDQAPRLVEACRRTWRTANAGWTLHSLERHNAAQFLDDPAVREAIEDPTQPPEAVSDRLRIGLLQQHGGLWVDATTYCLRPLDDWLFGVLETGFFAFHRPAAERLLSSWFLAAERENFIVRCWAQATRDYWAAREQRHAYFWFHELFSSEYEKDPLFRSLFDRTPKISADGPHYYLPQDVRLWQPFTRRDAEILTGSHAPLLKLSHKLPEGAYPAGSVAEHLCTRMGV